MRQKRTNREAGNMRRSSSEFTDIESHSRDFRSDPAGGTRRNASPGRRNPSSPDIGRDDDFRSFTEQTARKTGKTPRKTGQPAKRDRERRPSPNRRDTRDTYERQRRKPKRKMSKGARRFFIVTGFFLAVVVTALIGVFLVFKVDTIKVTGDKTYNDSDVIGVCGYQVGDNLFFLSTTDKEQLLSERLPYIEKAKITRKIPGTIEIEITAAAAASCVEFDGKYVCTDRKGKILEINDTPKEQVMYVTGLVLENPSVGSLIQIQDDAQKAAYVEILEKVAEEEAVADITSLNLSDMYNISLMYQNRIEFQLGNAADLTYKIQYGLWAIRDTNSLSANARGKLDLSLAKETSRAPFTHDFLVGGEETGSGGGEAENSAPAYEPFASNPGRGGDIPDTPYTGEASGSNAEEDEPNGDEDGGTGDGDDSAGDDGTDETE